jgi:hypothetical protein
MMKGIESCDTIAANLIAEVDMPFAGVDAHKRYSRVVVKDEAGSILCRASLQNDVAAFQGFFSNIDGPTKAVLEAGRDWGVIYDLLEGIGVEPVLANPLKTRAIERKFNLPAVIGLAKKLSGSSLRSAKGRFDSLHRGVEGLLPPAGPGPPSSPPPKPDSFPLALRPTRQGISRLESSRRTARLPL